MKKREAFTLIELIAVLVILAILALIVTPLVMNIIKKARVSADKRSIDAYGRSIELAIADYLLDKGEFPTSIEQLTIEYTGDKVECNTTTLNEDSSVYLAECTVGGRTVSGYTYGKDNTPTYTAYKVGDEVTYNNVDYYVIKNSSTTEETVTLLKAEPLTVEEVNTYGGVGTDDNHVNKFSDTSQNTAYDQNGYGGMVYYSSSNCKPGIMSECTNDYNNSDIKYVIDNWAKKSVNTNDLIEARLIKYTELIDNLGYSNANDEVSSWVVNPTFTPNWVYSNDYSYWTMSPYTDSSLNMSVVYEGGKLAHAYGDENTVNIYKDNYIVVRPVIVISKSALKK